MGSPVIGYVVRMFPDPAQVFVGNEVLGLERLGCSLTIFAYRRPGQPAVHALFDRVRSPITYVSEPPWRQPFDLFAANVGCIMHNPGHYFRTLRYVFAHTVRNRSLHTWLRFFQATHVARGARRAGVRHFHAHFADGPTRIAMLASMLTGVPYSFTTHARDIFRAGIDRELLREKLEGASFVIGVSEYNKRFLDDEVRHLRKGHVRVVYNGVDLDRFRPDPAVQREPDLIFAAGRLVPKKGFADLIEACRLLVGRGRSFHCRIIGDGPLRAELESQAAGLDGVIEFVGAHSQEELAAEYQRAAIFVLPAVVPPDGNTDALPTVLLEAMASGCPVISTHVAGIPEIVDDNVNGLLVGPGNVPALAAAMERLLDAPQLRTQFGVDARRKAEERFDVTKNAAMLYRLFADTARVEPTPSR